jgi:hypothetical protein
MVEEGDMNIEFRSDREQTLADLMARACHPGIVAPVAEKDQ